jgi:hypothetical protein
MRGGANGEEMHTVPASTAETTATVRRLDMLTTVKEDGYSGGVLLQPRGRHSALTIPYADASSCH